MGMTRKHTDEDAINWLYGGDRDVKVEYHTIKRVRVRYPQQCCSIYHGSATQTIPKGQECVREAAKIDGTFRSAYTCLGCIEEAHKELTEREVPHA